MLVREGVWKPGDLLPPERGLAERFGVSRASVRDALRILEVSGWVSVRQGDGTRVAEPSHSLGRSLVGRLSDPNLVAELFEFRRIIEPEAAALAAGRALVTQLKQLRSLIEDQRLSTNDLHRSLEIDMAFHRAIAEASGNRIISEVVTQLTDGLRETRVRSIAKGFFPERSLRAHVKILQCLEARDPERARRAMRNHLQSVSNTAGGTLSLQVKKGGKL